MPIYEYQCEDCSRDDIELLVRANETPECPKCGSTKLAKKFSVPAAHSGKAGGGLPVMPQGGG